MIALRTVAVLLLTACGAGAAAPHPAVCRVAVQERDGQAFGSGTLIDARDGYGLVVTNWHVVRDATGKIEVRFPSGFKSEARPLKLDETWDLAALVVWRPPTEPAPLSPRPPQPGDRLTICGYGGGDYLAQTGRCTDYYSPEVGQPQELVELNVEARQGDSGGPIFNSRGELAGVLFGAAQGSTLGSFGGRVQTFLATLAPDIGKQQQMLAQSSAGQAVPDASRFGRSATPPKLTTIPPGAVDPFQVAERQAPNGAYGALRAAEAPEPKRTTVPPSNPWRSGASLAGTAAPPQSLTDRSSAPQLAAARTSPNGWFAPTGQAATAAFTPQSSAVSAGHSREPMPGGAVDWYEDGRTMLALLGVAAVVAAGLRSMG